VAPPSLERHSQKKKRKESFTKNGGMTCTFRMGSQVDGLPRFQESERFAVAASERFPYDCDYQFGSPWAKSGQGADRRQHAQ
jgi:hypothetical protein